MKQLVQSLLAEENLTRKKAEYLKRKYVREQGLKKLPLNSDVLQACTASEAKKLRQFLTIKPTRTSSGVSVIAIMPKPMGCPGKCIYCPTARGAPKSYTGAEPSTMRSKRLNWDACKTVQNRLAQLQKVGHDTSKNEVIVQGGTFPAANWNYQVEFIKEMYDGFNGKRSKTLAAAQKCNETAKNRVVGLTLETRPDWIFPDKFLELGTTRVELGLQSTDDHILKDVQRGHTVAQFVDAVADLKSHAFKVLYHIMPGLPGSTFESDLNMFKELFKDERFCPDMLKIYPTVVIKGTKLYELWKEGKYSPVDTQYTEDLLYNVMKICPKWCRIMRVQRDIPAPFIEAGPTQSNVREIVDNKIKKSKEIRFREVGHVFQRTGKTPEKVDILVESYTASGGTEYFISAEDIKQDILLGFCRLRLQHGKPAMVRELHVYGEVAPLGQKGKIQHKGLGKKLLARAEQIAKSAGKREIIVISGVGVREYYRKMGYKLKDSYMWKPL